MKKINFRLKYNIIVITLVVILIFSGCNNAPTYSDSFSDTSISATTEVTDTTEVTEMTEITEITETTQTSANSSSETEITTSETDNSEETKIGGEIAPEIVRVVDAYKSGDFSKLTDPKDIYVLNKAKEVIAHEINSDMTDYEKELAIHDYIIKNTHYDVDELNEHVDVDPDSFTAYGLLKNGKSVCLGYTRTFQLFMDILEIECLTIHSTAYGGEEHAWNMIKIDGDWYHIDLTWDDPIPDTGDNINHKFFNVTTLYMKFTLHEWDTSKFPKATSKKYNYNTLN